MNIYITAIVKAQTAHRTTVQAILENMVKQSRKESACILYDLHQDLTDENVFIFYEIWKNQQGLNQHNEQSYIKAFAAIVNEKLQQQPQIYLTKKL